MEGAWLRTAGEARADSRRTGTRCRCENVFRRYRVAEVFLFNGLFPGDYSRLGLVQKAREGEAGIFTYIGQIRNRKPAGSMQLRLRGHSFALPTIHLEFNKRHFVARQLFDYVWCVSHVCFIILSYAYFNSFLISITLFVCLICDVLIM